MHPKELQAVARRQPFEPFRLILTTGASYDIRHPDLIMVGQRVAIVGIPREQEGALFDSTLKVDLLHVVAIEELPGAAQSKNGPAA